MNFFHRLFPKLGKRKAMAIAKDHCLSDDLELHHLKPGAEEPMIYNRPQGDCWVIYAPWMDGKDGSTLRSSRVILVSKKSGEILYDGSANDEG